MPDPAESIVEKTAALARLEITPAEARRLGPQFVDILEAFRVLESLDVEGAPEMTRGCEASGVVRADEPRPSLSPEEALKNAPAPLDSFYSVPKTIGGEA